MTRPHTPAGPGRGLSPWLPGPVARPWLHSSGSLTSPAGQRVSRALGAVAMGTVQRGCSPGLSGRRCDCIWAPEAQRGRGAGPSSHSQHVPEQAGCRCLCWRPLSLGHPPRFPEEPRTAWPIAVTEEVRAQSRDAGSPFFQQMNLVSSISVSTAAPSQGHPRSSVAIWSLLGGSRGSWWHRWLTGLHTASVNTSHRPGIPKYAFPNHRAGPAVAPVSGTAQTRYFSTSFPKWLACPGEGREAQFQRQSTTVGGADHRPWLSWCWRPGVGGQGVGGAGLS